jgi:hypothetical protein
MPQWRARLVPTVLPSDSPVAGPTGVALTRTTTLPVAVKGGQTRDGNQSRGIEVSSAARHTAFAIVSRNADQFR